MPDTVAPPVAARMSLPIGLLAAVGFLSSAGARVIDPLLPVIANDFSASIPQVSILVAAFTLPYGLMQLVLGPLGDRFGKLRVMLGALTGYALAMAACSLAGSLEALTLLRITAGGASAGLIPVCMAYIGDAVPYELRQVTLSRFLTGVVTALVLAGPVGGMFGEYIGWRGVFLLLAGIAVLVATSLALRIGGMPDRRGGNTFKASTYVLLLRQSGAPTLLAATLLNGAVLTGSFPFLAPYMYDRFGLSYAAVGLILACFGLGAYGYTRSASRLVPALGESWLVRGGGLLMAAAMVAAVLAPWWWSFIPIEAALGLGYMMLHGSMQARATELLPDKRATAVSFFVFLLFMGQSLGAVVTGHLIGVLGFHRAFLIQGAGILLLGLWVGGMLARHRPPRHLAPAGRS